MLKNVYEPSCMKWWDFPQINDDYWYSIEIENEVYHLLAMKKPGSNCTDVRLPYQVDHVENFEGFTDDEVELLEKHFGVALFRLD